jgi:hypothetical protein
MIYIFIRYLSVGLIATFFLVPLVVIYLAFYGLLYLHAA